ncbi:serine/threonine-protein kinase PLK1 [Sphaerodactylus townsendi]|uniref:serine/threonine-protein kinase PLK1 n=1 Tax=Sphaerodactylus townsendi TaxID=933632 RepID=UPI002026FEEE|nr:serine/threonine-protein kinase PLK1 [Sphaerodactylus townsendi]
MCAAVAAGKGAAAKDGASSSVPVPEELLDPRSGRRYSVGRFLGKGGFAKCYELTEAGAAGGAVLAGKVVPKALLMTAPQRQKMAMEVAIHRTLQHRHVVAFHGFFEDPNFVFVVLELCRRRSLLELHKRRKMLTEPEVRYYLRQIVLGCQYLHANKVIHRDLKLGNIFLNDDMEVKIGDFGLATKVEYEGERKKTLCGTPNYIAPEVLSKKGHSFEVDIWSIGCIMYTLLVGKPPFETSCLKETYMRIKKNNYTIPLHINPVAANLIRRMLRPDPATRPTIEELLSDDFFSTGYTPSRLPPSCLTVAPRFSLAPNGPDTSGRKPLTVVNKAPECPTTDKPPEREAEGAQREPDDSVESLLMELFQQLRVLNSCRPSERVPVKQEEAEDPACIPIFWVSKWVDYSDKYGLGYQLCDNSVGVLFNDSTRLLMYNDGDSLQYIDQNSSESYYNLQSCPDSLTKKITLLKYFRNYMSEHLLKAGGNITPREGDELARLPYLRTWFRTRSAIILHLSNGTVQINFFEDHTKVILCPLMAAVSYINERREFRTYKLSLIEEFGCSKELASRLRFARTMVEKLLANKGALLSVPASS